MPRLEIQGDMQVDSSQLGEDGWSSLVKLEIQLLRELIIDYSSKTALQCHRAKHAAEAKNSISGRLRSLIQGTNLGRTLWAGLKDAADSAISPSSLTSEVKERAESIRKSDIVSLFDKAKNGGLLLDAVAQNPLLVPAVLKTKEALVQLPGSTDASCAADHQLLEKATEFISCLASGYAVGALETLAGAMEGFWTRPIGDSRWYKHMDVFLGVLVTCKAQLMKCMGTVRCRESPVGRVISYS